MNVIFTKHAQQRLEERGFAADLVEQTLRKPESSRAGRQAGTREFTRSFGKSRVSVVAQQKGGGEWVVVSCWIDPPVFGTKDWYKKERYREYQRAPWWKKFLFLLGRQVGFIDF